MAWAVAAVTEAGEGGGATTPPVGVLMTGDIAGVCGVVGDWAGPGTPTEPCLLVRVAVKFVDERHNSGH